MTNTLTNPTLSNKRNRQLSIQPQPNNYGEFLDFLYDDLEYAISKLIKTRDKYYDGMINNSRYGEDLINTSIANMLDMRGWDAKHSTHVNGNVDIIVTLPYEDYCWLGEGKINNSYVEIFGGFKQLFHRYSTGVDCESSGGVLVYVSNTNLSLTEIIKRWKNHFEEHCNQTIVIDGNDFPTSPVKYFSNCPKNSLVFYSHHEHPSTGLDYCIRHMFIDFRYKPKD